VARMSQSSLFRGRLKRAIDRSGRSGATRRLAVVPLLGLTLAAMALVAPAVASADNSSQLTIVGTSDVSDSGLMPNLIQPEFHAAFPQFTFKYTGSATGAAITAAESGSAAASVLIVHAPSLENQFVANGFSYEAYGRALFTNDFIFAGPAADPAGVSANAANNIVQAFIDVATAGINGGGSPAATFVSRGGAAGTTVEEHQVWALVATSANRPTGLGLCTVSVASGGGMAPVAPANPTNGSACTGPNGLPAPGDLPAWYIASGLTQGPNVVLANACASEPSPPNTCYVLTDRGTYDYLASGNDPAGTVPNLSILTRNNSASAPGGSTFLTNYFHAYIINPAKPNEAVNLPAAQDFLNFLTSPALQGQLKSYLDTVPATVDPGGPPFVADASPGITATGFPSSDPAGTPVTVTGTLSNSQPGFPALAGQTVSVDEIEAGLPVAVASGATDANGNYSIKFTPTSSGSYQVSTGQIAQIENATLSPVFGDLLSPAATAAVSMSVQGAVTVTSATAGVGSATVAGSVSPVAQDGNATITLLARPVTSTGAYTQIGGQSLAAGASSFSISAALGKGLWQLEVIYTDPGQVLGASATADVLVNAAGGGVSFKKLTVKKGKVTLTATITPVPAGGGKVLLFATPAGKSKKFPQVAHKTLAAGKTQFTISVKLKPGHRWLLQLEYAPADQKATFSKLRSIAVH
jgi:tungstate transport system substrate-binding protein